MFGRGRLYAEFVSGEDVDIGQFDLVLASIGTYRRFTHCGVRDIASLASDKYPDPNHAEGSVIAVINRPGAPETLVQLWGMRLITTGPKAFTGHQVAMGELLAAGYDPERFFSAMPVAYHDMSAALAWLRRCSPFRRASRESAGLWRLTSRLWTSSSGSWKSTPMSSFAAGL